MSCFSSPWVLNSLSQSCNLFWHLRECSCNSAQWLLSCAGTDSGGCEYHVLVPDTVTSTGRRCHVLPCAHVCRCRCVQMWWWLHSCTGAQVHWIKVRARLRLSSPCAGFFVMNVAVAVVFDVLPSRLMDCGRVGAFCVVDTAQQHSGFDVCWQFVTLLLQWSLGGKRETERWGGVKERYWRSRNRVLHSVACRALLSVGSLKCHVSKEQMQIKADFSKEIENTAYSTLLLFYSHWLFNFCD